MHFFRLLLIFLSCSLPMHAFADDQNMVLQPLNLSLRYNLYWNGLPLGRVRVEIAENSSMMSARVDTKSRGLAELFSPMRSVIASEALKAADGSYIPTGYRAEGKADDGQNVTTLSYDSSGVLNKRTRTPPDDPKHRPTVPVDQLKKAYDPISGFLVARRAMMANLKAKQPVTTVQTYDGRRLAEFSFRAVNPGTKMLGNKIYGMINTVLKRKPLQGYTEKELKKYDKGDPNVHVYFSQNGIFLPFAIEADIGFGMIKLHADEESLSQLFPDEE